MVNQRLKSFAFTLRAIQRLTITAHMGRALQQLVLKAIGRVDRAGAEQIHEGTTSVRSYTVSALFSLNSMRPVSGPIAPGDAVWFRVSALTDATCIALERYQQEYGTGRVELDNADWQIEPIESGSGGWSGEATYLNLAARYQSVRPAQSLGLRFMTPTGFHSKGNTVPVPLPSLVFESLIGRWNAFSPLPMPDLLYPFVDQHVTIGSFRGETCKVILKHGHVEIGFVGEVNYHIVRRNRTLDNVDPVLANVLEANARDLTGAINTLADFAFYSSVGIKSAVGMGMVRRIT